jgi:hypothetical protein
VGRRGGEAHGAVTKNEEIFVPDVFFFRAADE